MWRRFVGVGVGTVAVGTVAQLVRLIGVAQSVSAHFPQLVAQLVCW